MWGGRFLGGNFPDLRRSREESLIKTGNSKQIDEGDVGSDAQAAKEGALSKGRVDNSTEYFLVREVRGSIKNAHVHQFAYTGFQPS